VLKRDQYRCSMCGAQLTLGNGSAHIDHVVPRAEGGSDDESNLRALCYGCNVRRGRRQARGYWGAHRWSAVPALCQQGTDRGAGTGTSQHTALRTIGRGVLAILSIEIESSNDHW